MEPFLDESNLTRLGEQFHSLSWRWSAQRPQIDVMEGLPRVVSGDTDLERRKCKAH
jgi:hypothetical protein